MSSFPVNMAPGPDLGMTAPDAPLVGPPQACARAASAWGALPPVRAAWQDALTGPTAFPTLTSKDSV
jgi:hypothetical protein